MKDSKKNHQLLICVLLAQVYLLTSGCTTTEFGLENAIDNAKVSGSNNSFSGSSLITSSSGSQKLVASHDARIGSQVAKSKQVKILGFIEFGDSMADAAKKAGISQITSVEKNTSAAVYPFFRVTTTTISGEEVVVPSYYYSDSFPFKTNQFQKVQHRGLE
jgi:hypothetical protein